MQEKEAAMGNNEVEESIRQELRGFRLPRYRDIPDVGLLLDQTCRLVNHYLEQLGDIRLTPSMISNYVKQRIIGHPVKKLYYRDQVAYLVFIAVAKNVLSLEDIKKLLELQKERYSIEDAYLYFCEAFEQGLQALFCGAPLPEESAAGDSVLKDLLRHMIITTAHKIYLDKYLRELIG